MALHDTLMRRDSLNRLYAQTRLSNGSIQHYLRRNRPDKASPRSEEMLICATWRDTARLPLLPSMNEGVTNFAQRIWNLRRPGRAKVINLPPCFNQWRQCETTVEY